ncbi:MAG: response regulator transcription factor [bacterium]
MNSTILIAEDDRKIAAAIKLYLEREGYRVFLAENGRDALREARARKPALIILDLMLPQLSGIDVCRILRAESDLYIIMLTARTTEEDKLRGLDLGADDYVTKPFSPRELMARIRAVLRRQRTELSPGPTEIGSNGLLMNLERHEVSLNEKPVNLTAAEFKLLATLIRAPERVFTRQQLVERAFGVEYDGLERTIDAHIMNLRKKIKIDNPQTSFIVTVYGVGYKFSPGNHAS